VFLRLFILILPKTHLPEDKIGLKTPEFGPVVHIKNNLHLNYMHFRVKMDYKSLLPSLCDIKTRRVARVKIEISTVYKEETNCPKN